MLKTLTKSDIFASDADVIVNPVNTVGIMGAGLALQFKNRFPEMFADYQRACREQRLRIGTLHGFIEGGKRILNFPTKEHWRNPSQLRYIEAGLDAFLRHFHKPQHRTWVYAFPRLGAGLGGLSWSDVEQIIRVKLVDFNIEIHSK